MAQSSLVGVLLMSFGTAATLEDVPAYLASVRGGRSVPPDLVAEFQRRFGRVGGSPLIRITRDQAAALESFLNRSEGDKARYQVAVGMRHSPPFIADALADLTAQARRIVGIILSPQYSPIIMGGYLRAVEAARGCLPAGTVVGVAGAWYDVPEFIAGLAQQVRRVLNDLSADERARVPIIFTAHSLPRSVADGEPGYIQQLQETARAVAEAAGIAPERWSFAYQSAGHTPEPWLSPDVKDLLPGLAAAGHRYVLVVPVQFLADHLEVLYDIDVAAREEAATAGISLLRTDSLNTAPFLIAALAQVVRNELSAED